MRSVAPDRPGSAASQNSWSVVKANPIAGSRATTTLHTIHTANESSRQYVEIHRLRRAIGRPAVCQNSGSSGRQSAIGPALRGGATKPGSPMPCISGSSGTAAAVPRRAATASM